MMGNRKLFSSYKAYNGGNVIFGSNLGGKIIGKGTISNDSLKIDNVEHVDNLGFNLLSDWDHANMRLIQSLASKELVRNLPKLRFDQHFCDACKIGKQVHVSHKAKNIVSMTRCLELLHMDLFGPSTKKEESLNVTFDETPPPSKTSPLVDDDLDEEEAIREIKKKNLENIVEDETLEIDDIVNIKESRNHPLENIIGNLNQRTLRLFKHVVSISPELAFDRYLSHDRAMHPLAPHYERKIRADRGKKRPREPNASSSSSTLNHPSSSHPLNDSTHENDDESSHSNPSSPPQNTPSSSNNVSRVPQNPPHESHDLKQPSY
ncbi:hypothetical protein Tco_0443032 [Tanacetum coccineum]